MPIWEEPARGGYPDPRLFGLPGLEQARTYLRVGGPRPPISHLVGISFDRVGKDTADFSMPASRWLLSHLPIIPGGVLAILADAPLGTAVQTSLPLATAYTTAELSMTFLRPATIASGRISAHGQLIHGGRSVGLSEVFCYDAQDRLLAHGTSRCFIFPPLEPAPEPPPEDWRPEVPTYDGPDPWERPVEGGPLAPSDLEEMSGLDVLRGWIDGDLLRPPLYYLTGSRPTEAGEGTAAQILPASEWLNSPLGRIQGGAEVFLADLAMADAVMTTLPPRTAFATLDFKVNFLRPAVADGRDLVARAQVDHRGKRLATARADVFDADGKRLATATGSTMLLPGRPPSLVVPEEEAPAEDAGGQEGA